MKKFDLKEFLEKCEKNLEMANAEMEECRVEREKNAESSEKPINGLQLMTDNEPRYRFESYFTADELIDLLHFLKARKNVIADHTGLDDK